MTPVHRTSRTPGRANLISGLALLCAFPSPAFGATQIAVTPVLVQEDEIPPAARLGLAQTLAAELDRVEGIDAQFVPDWSTVEASQPAAVLLRQGKRLAARLRTARAIDRLRRGLDAFADDPSVVDDFDDVVEAKLVLAESYFRRGREADALRTLKDFARLRPEYVLSRSDYPPVFVNAWRQARRETRSEARGSLAVETEDKSSQIFVDGIERGRSPVRVDDLPVGRHYVVVRGETLQWGRAVDVVQQSVVRVEVAANADSDAPRDKLDASLRYRATQTAVDAEAAYVVILAMRRSADGYDVSVLLGDASAWEFTRVGVYRVDGELRSWGDDARRASRGVARRIREAGVWLKPNAPLFPARIALGVPRAGAPVRAETARAPTEAFRAESGPTESVSTESLHSAAESEPELELQPLSTPLSDPAALRMDSVPSEADSESSSIFDRWWFWAAAGGVAAALAGGTWWALRDGEPDEVSVEAVW
ncbi:MAG: PEGA domain-containing protein [Myxococcota bacterium]